MNNYEKQSYLNKFLNYEKMLSFGIPAKPPDFVKFQLNDHETPVEGTVSKRKPRQKSTCDEEWIPGEKSSWQVAKDKLACHCGVSFVSKRSFSKHKEECKEMGQNIAGKHLKDITTQDLMQMGLKFGTSIDILKLAKSGNSCGSQQTLQASSDNCRSENPSGKLPTDFSKPQSIIHQKAFFSFEQDLPENSARNASDNSYLSMPSCLSSDQPISRGLPERTNTSVVQGNSQSRPSISANISNLRMFANASGGTSTSVPEHQSSEFHQSDETAVDHDNSWRSPQFSNFQAGNSRGSQQSTDFPQVNSLQQPRSISQQQAFFSCEKRLPVNSAANMSDNSYMSMLSCPSSDQPISQAGNSRGSQQSTDFPQPRSISQQQAFFACEKRLPVNSAANMSDNSYMSMLSCPSSDQPISQGLPERTITSVVQGNSQSRPSISANISNLRMFANASGGTSTSVLEYQSSEFHQSDVTAADLNGSWDSPRSLNIQAGYSCGIQQETQSTYMSGIHRSGNLPTIMSQPSAALQPRACHEQPQQVARQFSTIALNGGNNSNQSPAASWCSTTAYSAQANPNAPNRPPLRTIQAVSNSFNSDQLPPVFKDALNNLNRVKCLLAEKKATMLPQHHFNVRLIIQKINKGEEILASLDSGTLIFGTKRMAIVNALTLHLFDNVAHPSQVSTCVREAMAVCFISEWPHMRKLLLTRDDRPWYDWYHPNNIGYLANTTATTQKKLIKDGKGVRRKGKPDSEIQAKVPRKLKSLPTNVDNCPEDPDPIDFVKDVNELDNTVASPGERLNILNLMRRTYQRRKEKFHNKDTSAQIEQEFNLSFPGKSSNFVREYTSDMMLKILKVGEDPKYSECKQYGYDILNSFWILLKFLPVPRRTYEHESKMPLHAKFEDFFHIIPPGSDPQQEVKRRYSEETYPLQPHILAIGSKRNIQTMYLVLGDGLLLNLKHSATPTKAIDLLLKTFFALQLHYPLGWKNAFRFIQVHIFDMPPDRPRESTFSEKLLILKHTTLVP
ncbi:Ribosomal RNA large subunit methyltransferase G [Frankliniella fusca]|uniref:Ribosomal RNA large subunit methyltransferase G n=1 Tax=Frankliniella fusca TaxID=407009 RepID=A0AAE1HEZ1_9NEOP|nr:Ribosomal RNA large subunit methyltransferase G [Frankliniella fusca]